MTGASVYRSRQPPGSESRPPETPRDPIATKEGRGGGGQEKGTGLSGRPPKPVVKSVPRNRRQQEEERAGPSTASLTISPARARPGQTHFRIGTWKEFRGAPTTTVSPEGPGHGVGVGRQNSLALPESAPGLWKNDEEPVSGGRDQRVRPYRSASSSGVLHARSLPAPTYGAPRD